MASHLEGPGVGRSGSRADWWRERIRACEASGLSIERFCREQGVSVSGYHWWKRELKRREAPVPAPVPVFAEVKMAVEGIPPVEAAALEVVLAGDRRVRVYPGFDEATLKRLVPVLEALSC